MGNEHILLDEFLQSRNRKRSRQREEILNLFLSSRRHVTVLELYREVRKQNPHIGFVTVYRTLKLLCESGLCRELKLEDGIARYEKQVGHEHHDHLVCTKCGRVVEVVDNTIELHQERLFKKYGFYPQRHRMELYGVCKGCKKG
ncbi:MAG: transcriptional repressor [Candidatus Omnitrophota bacterium]